MESQDRQPDPPVTPPAPSPAGEPAPPADAAPAEPNLRQWLAYNFPWLALFLALAVFLSLKFDWNWWDIGKAALGLGFVIFIHELGHFLVAKWCDVHVQTFSIGFGPALPGCKFTWGETTYKIALIPLGGYVQMVGEGEGEDSSESDDDPRSYRNKSVWQRMAIISAGVTMNALLAVVCFVLVFMIPGKERVAGVVGTLDSGGVAFQMGVPSGARIRQVGAVTDPYFERLMVTVMATQAGEKLTFRYEFPQGQEQTLELEPRVERSKAGRPMLGIAQPPRLTLISRRLARELERPTQPGTAADQADPPFEFGDQVIAMTDPDHPENVTELPRDWRQPEDSGKTAPRDYFAFRQRLRRLADREITLRVLRPAEGKLQEVDLRVPPAYHNVLAARMLMGQITVVCAGSPAATDPKNRLQPRDPAKSQEGDVITRVEVTEPDGKTRTIYASEIKVEGSKKPLHEQIQPLDPVRLPDQLRAWAQRLEQAGVPTTSPLWQVTLHLRRHTTNQPGPQYTNLTVRLPWQKEKSDLEVAPLGPHAPQPLPELGLAYQVRTTVVATEPRLLQPGDETLQPGDEIKKLRPYVRDAQGAEEAGSWMTLADGDEWASAFHRLQGQAVSKVEAVVQRSGQQLTLSLPVRPDPTWPLLERGWIFDMDLRLQKAANAVQAISMGIEDTCLTMLQVFQNLRGVISGRISIDNWGGPITIARFAYRIAGVDFWEFLFFLGLISINLAVINFLPIPILDGGHMAFLIYEAIRGKPASERVRLGAAYVGLILIAGLMLFVFYLDISRLFGG